MDAKCGLKAKRILWSYIAIRALPKTNGDSVSPTSACLLLGAQVDRKGKWGYHGCREMGLTTHIRGRQYLSQSGTLVREGIQLLAFVSLYVYLEEQLLF